MDNEEDNSMMVMMFGAAAFAEQIYSDESVHRRKQRKQKKCWVRDWVLRRSDKGFYTTLLRELEIEDPNAYRNFLRMSSSDFDYLLNLVAPLITKEDTVMRKAISAGEKLCVTLRYLATGETFSSLQYLFRIPKNTISAFIIDVCEAIYNVLKDDHLKVPSSESEWLEVETGFNDKWNFPHCIGAVDGKHVVMTAPPDSGSIYFNYKGTHSIVLMGICDSSYRFLYVDVGANGRISDGGVFSKCSFHRALNSNENLLHVPAPCELAGRNEKIPYLLVGDDAFALGQHLMKPYPHKNFIGIERIFNYRLSRARRTIENAFGILAMRFRVFGQPMLLSPQKCRTVTKAACVLHNFLINRNTSSNYIQAGLADEYDETGHLVPGSWRQNVTPNNFYGMEHRGQLGATSSIQKIRDELAQYFVNEGEVDFQYKQI